MLTSTGPAGLSPRPAHTARAAAAPLRVGMTLVELLVVIAVIGVLMSLMLPALQASREQARFVVCTNNLRQIGITTHMYRDVHDGLFPHGDRTGNYSYRMAPGLKSNDRSALPESYGLEAVFVEENFLPHDSGIWVCPSQPEWMPMHGNTYAFSVASTLKKRRNPENQATSVWVWDNYNMLPGLSGFRGPFAGYSIASKDQVYPHGSLRSEGYNVLYQDGHVEYKAF